MRELGELLQRGTVTAIITMLSLVLAAVAGGVVGWMLGVTHAHRSLSEKARGLLRAVMVFRERHMGEADKIVERTPSQPRVDLWDDFPTVAVPLTVMTCHDWECPDSGKHPCHRPGCGEHER